MNAKAVVKQASPSTATAPLAPAKAPLPRAAAQAMRVTPEFYSASTYTPEESFAYLMRRILSALAHEVERQLSPTGLTNAQWIPLYKLYLGSATTVAELARECELDAGAMTRLLDRVEAKGLCRRVRSSEDRRVVNLELLPKGREFAKSNIPQVLSQVQNRFLDGFSEAEWASLHGYLLRILDNAQGIAEAGGQREK